MDSWRRLRLPWRAKDNAAATDGQPLIKHVPPVSAPKPAVRRASDTWNFKLKDFRPGSYVLLDDNDSDVAAATKASYNDRRFTSIPAWIGRHKLFVGCCLPLLSALLETTMLSLLLYVYMSLPWDTKTGLRQRVSPLYSLWPFVSCVASLKLAAYQAFLFIICFFSVSGASLSFWWNRNVHPGYWLRRISLAQSLFANVLLIWLLFASADNKTHIHLYLVALRLLLLFGTKSAVWLTWRVMRNAYPQLPANRISTRSFWIKCVVMPPAFVLALLANVGVFSCHDPDVVRTEGTTCYHLVAMAAISDWLYSVVNVVFLFNLAYDLYYDQYYGRLRRGLPLLGDLHFEDRRTG